MVKCLFAYYTCKEFPVLECHNLPLFLINLAILFISLVQKGRISSFGKFDNGSGPLVPANTDICPG